MKIVGIDIETTGLEQSKGHRIIEFAAVTYDEHGNKLDTFTQRINPERPIDPGAQEVHGISFEDVANCPTIEQVAPKIVEILQSADVIVAHNGQSFDWPFIGGELMRLGVKVPMIELVDTMLQARWATPYGKFPNLGELCFACEVDYDPEAAHAAEYDVCKMMESFFAVLPGGWFKLPFSNNPLKEAA